MFKRIRSKLFILLILLLIPASTVYIAAANEHKAIKRTEIQEALGKTAYDYLKGKGYRVVDYNTAQFKLDLEVSPEQMIALDLLNMDVTKYFDKTIKAYNFEIMKNMWSQSSFYVRFVTMNGKILGKYYTIQDHVKYIDLFSLDGKNFKSVTDEAYITCVKDYNDKWIAHIEK